MRLQELAEQTRQSIEQTQQNILTIAEGGRQAIQAKQRESLSHLAEIHSSSPQVCQCLARGIHTLLSHVEAH